MEARKALAGAREVFGTAKWRGMGGAYNLPAREAIFFLCQGWHKFVEKQAEKSRKFLEGRQIDGEIMG